MPTTYEDQFYTLDPGNPPAVGSAVNFARLSFIDSNNDGVIRPNTGDTVNGRLVTSVWRNDTVTIRLANGTNVTYRGTTFYVQGGPAVFTPNDGQVLRSGTFVRSTFVNNSTNMPVNTFGPTCFTPGTMIDTPAGPRLIETLVVGDLIETLDDGAQPIRAILRDSYRAEGDFAPIRFETGAVGNTAPLTVSQQHRILISGWKAELYFGTSEVLVAAKHLVNGSSVTRQEGGDVEYIHLVFDQHQIIFGQGTPSESYYPDHARSLADAEARAEVLALFPGVAATLRPGRPFARPVVGRAAGQLLAA